MDNSNSQLPAGSAAAREGSSKSSSAVATTAGKINNGCHTLFPALFLRGGLFD